MANPVPSILPDRRSVKRRRVLKGGIVAFNNRHCAVPCSVRDISNAGARIRVESTFNVPDRFELIIEIDGLGADCKVAWRKGNDIGVRFIGECRHARPGRPQVVSAVVPETAHHLRLSTSGHSKPHPSAIGEVSASSGDGAVGRQPTGTVETLATHAERCCKRPGEGLGISTGGTRTQHDNLLAVLLTAQPEVFRTAILVAVSSSLANALQRQSPRVIARLLVKYYPRESATLILASSRISRWFGRSPLRSRLDQCHSALTQAKQSTIDFASISFADDERHTGQTDILARCWRDAANAVMAVLLEIDALLTLHHAPGSLEVLMCLLDELASARAGGSPFLDDHGNVKLPSWAERRERERARVNAPAQLHWNGGSQGVVIRDMSASGLGLECSAGLPDGAVVELHIGNTLLLHGTVAWSMERRAGIHLAEPLHGPDPLLAFCTRGGETPERW